MHIMAVISCLGNKVLFPCMLATAGVLGIARSAKSESVIGLRDCKAHKYLCCIRLRARVLNKSIFSPNKQKIITA